MILFKLKQISLNIYFVLVLILSQKKIKRKFISRKDSNCKILICKNIAGTFQFVNLSFIKKKSQFVQKEIIKM